MVRIILSALILAALSLSLPGCFDKTNPVSYVYVQDSTRNDAGIKNPVTVHLSFSATSNLQIVAGNDIVFTGAPSFIPDSIVVPDSSRLLAKWYTGNTAQYADTIASPGLVWAIH